MARRGSEGSIYQLRITLLDTDPEDCGGIPGYYMLLEAIQDPEHPDHEEMFEWVGEDYNPVAFDPDEVNRRLRELG
jgi:hypothetical protein